MGKRNPIREHAVKAAVSIIAATGGVHARTGPEVTPFRDTTAAIEQAATVITDAGKAADDSSSADDVARKAETVEDQLTSETDDQERPEADPDGDDPQKVLLDLEGDREEEKKKKAKEELELRDREEVSSGHITGPAPPAAGDSTVTSEEQVQEVASADGEWSEAAAEADEQRAEAAADADQQRAEAAADADQQRAEAVAWADDESHQQAVAQDEERSGRPAEECEPADETWLEDDADVNGPDID